MGFFASSALHKQPPTPLVARCGACGLYAKCRTPKMPVQGEGRAGVLLVSGQPDEIADEDGLHITGDARGFLSGVLAGHGLDLYQDCWLTSAAICTGDGKAAIGHCRPNLTAAIATLRPHTVVLFGWAAVESLVGSVWKESAGELSRWVGWQIPYRDGNYWICPTWHPVTVRRTKDDDPCRLWFRRHLGAALRLGATPYPAPPPPLTSQVERIFDSTAAAAIIRQMVARGGPTAFDYETNCLKPETKGAAIASCSICWRGKKTIAYPWHGDAIVATGEYLRSPSPKVAANMKFEDRWTRATFGHRVRNLTYDTMQGSHVQDNRRGGINSVKFQSFVRLGANAYDDHIKPYLEGEDSTGINQVFQEIELNQLLLYNGLDSLQEYMGAEKQMALFGKDLNACQ